MKRRFMVVMAGLLSLLGACTGVFVVNEEEAYYVTPSVEVEGNAERGRQLIINYGCGTCHMIPGIPGADTYVGPSLAGYAYNRYVGGVLINTPEQTIRWIQEPHAVSPDTSMPDLGVPDVDARDIVAYLYTLR